MNLIEIKSQNDSLIVNEIYSFQDIVKMLKGKYEF